MKRLTRPTCVVVLAAVLVACGGRGQQTPPAEVTPPAATPPATASTPVSTPAPGQPCPYPPSCGANCSNQPFVPTDCWTTPYGPAKADVVSGNPVKSPNMLYCDGGTYALCFFSGPLGKTGVNPANKPLPCVLDGDIAKCTCQAYTSGPYFVDITSILNRGAYDQTVAACGQDGSGCQNIENCWPDGKKPGCSKHKQAPVCQYVQNQNPNDPSTSLIPKADLISTFSFAMDGDYKLGSTSCNGLYAGCMTAPCFRKPGQTSPPTNGEPVECHCPTYTGDYQIGQSNQTCSIAGGDKAAYTWSASNTVPAPSGQ
jgi:hypothetical protein